MQSLFRVVLMSRTIDEVSKISFSSTFRCDHHPSKFLKRGRLGTTVEGTNALPNEVLNGKFINIYFNVNLLSIDVLQR